MGMSTHCCGFKPADDKWKKIKAVYDSCKAAGIDPPRDVEEYFGFDEPDKNGVKISEDALEKCGALKVFDADGYSGLEVDITKLPKDVKIIRFYNSY